VAHARQGQRELKLARVAIQHPWCGGKGISHKRGQGEEQSGEEVFATQSWLKVESEK
jgi:hypothetical protein